MAKRTLCTLWKTYDRGDHLTTPELKRLAKSAKGGLDYLVGRGEQLAVMKTVADLNAIEGYIQARQSKVYG